MRSETVRNWDGNRSWSPADINHPEDENQIAALIKQAFDFFNRLRQTFDPHGLFRNSFVDRVFPAD